MRHKILFIIFLYSSLFGYSQSNPFQKKFPLIDQYIDSLMKTWKIPGLAIGVVYGDQLIFGKGYGYRDLEKKLPVQTTTIFPIASNTKLFTATSVCMLANEGKLNLDKPVKTYMPSLNFFNDELNAGVTLRDMLSHRTGLPTYNGIWISSTSTRKEAVEKVAYMKPMLGFREGFIYNNMMFAASGAVIENISGTSWEEDTRKRLLQPLEMNATVFTDTEMIGTGNFSYSYFAPDSTKELKKITYMAQSNALGPAGTIKSTIEDMSHWMIVQLNNGKYKGRQVIPESVIRETLIPNNIADKTSRWNELSNGLYGLGRQIQMYKGYKITTHTGSIDGFYSNLTFIPSEKLGVFVIYNSRPAGIIRTVIAFPIIDRLLDLAKTNWSERYLKIDSNEIAADVKERDSIKASAIKNTVPSHPLKDFTGVYQSPIYGEMQVELKDNLLIMMFRKQQSSLIHFHFDQFVTNEQMTDRPEFRLHFLTGANGEIDRISLRPYGDAVAEFVKVKK